MIIGAAVPRPTRFIMDHQFARGWFTRLFLKQGKVILIATAKEDPELLKRALDQAVQALKDGEVVCLFPEGVITRDGKMSSFRPGIERILERVQVPIVPMALHGLWGSFFSREGGQAIKKVPKRFWSRIVLKIGPQLPPEGQTAASLESVVRAMVDPKMP
jgi:1-acyl-sn-glycerol-3-phosphate acyltransferase